MLTRSLLLIASRLPTPSFIRRPLTCITSHFRGHSISTDNGSDSELLEKIGEALKRDRHTHSLMERPYSALDVQDTIHRTVTAHNLATAKEATRNLINLTLQYAKDQAYHKQIPFTFVEEKKCIDAALKMHQEIQNDVLSFPGTQAVS